MIIDKNIAWNRKRVFLPAFNMLGVLADAAQGAGAPAFGADLAGSELVGLLMAAAGDEVYTMWPIPWDLDKDEPIRLRLWFTHGSTDADDPDWLVSLKAIAKQAAISDAASTPDEAIAFAAKAVSTTANSLEVLDWEITVSNTFLTALDRALLIAIECNGLGSASANEIILYGLEIEYTVKATGTNNRRETTTNAPVAS
ncbi:MAG: hypothetical protein BBJ57_07450 [Desulfobacterales bacterium PC51MH44]|nr:MAG: hypothetical protein BBJ57_07450 [Desulfobacterales bacterium PC51MH44]